jgi:hypothetical protein
MAGQTVGGEHSLSNAVGAFINWINRESMAWAKETK